MKKLSFLIVAAAVVTGCAFNGSTKSSPRARQEFTATFIVPLTEGRLNGESTILDKKLVKAVNLDLLKPVVLQMVQDAYNGRLSTHPDYPDAPAYNPKTHFRERLDKISGANPNFSHACISLQAGYDCRIRPEANVLSISYLDFIWVDESQLSSEVVISRVLAKDLEKYQVKRLGLICDLREFLDNGHYERYPIRVESPMQFYGIRTHSEAVEVREVIRYGDVARLARPLNVIE